jgi:3-methyladenine DNA glycosylase/8-oxoguanine DNA glycosylase
MTRPGRSTPPPAEAHLAAVCKGMARYAPKQTPFPMQFDMPKDPFRALTRAVVFQQLSGKAAATIHGRLIARFAPSRHPDPQDILAARDEDLRAVGLSRQKIAALRDIAQKRIDGVIPGPRTLSRMSDEEIIERLTAARGVGRWTAEMYLIFSLGRPDVLPLDDLGVRKGAERILGRAMTIRELAAYGERWAPWRSAAAWHCWRATETVTMDELD